MTIRRVLRWTSRGTAQQLLRELLICIALPSALLVSANVVAQQTATAPSQQRSDEQIANDINSKLMASESLHPLGLGIWVHDGTATLSGTVPTEALRQQADAMVQAVPGVKSVDDKLTVGAAPTNGSHLQEGEAPSNQNEPPPPGPPPPPPSPSELQGESNGGQANGYGYPPARGQQPGPGQQGPEQYSPSPAVEDSGRPRPMLTVSTGTPLYVMMLRTLDSKHTKPGAAFRGVLAQDLIVSNGAIAVPRGAYVEGTVIDARPTGHLKGRPKLALQLSHLDMGNSSYPLACNIWFHEGPGKGGQTAVNVGGSAAFGAVAGGIVGGGPTALLGAALGGLGGAGLSALSPGARLLVPAESVITFRLTAPLTVREPTPGEVRSLDANLPPSPYGYRGYGYGYPPPPPNDYPGGYPPPPQQQAPVPGAPPGGYPY